MSREMGEYLVWGVILLLLLICSIEDIRKQKISVLWVFLLLPCSVLYGVLAEGGQAIWQMLAGGMAGLILAGISRLTRQLGEGDAVVLGILMAGLPFMQSILFLILCFWYAFWGAVFIVVFFHAGKQRRIPFLPSIFLGYLSLYLLCWSGSIPE